MWPGFDSRTQRHMLVEFVVGSRPCSERIFSKYFKSQFDLESEGHRFVSRNRLLSVTPGKACVKRVHNNDAFVNVGN